ncbi:MAG: HEAT repeat domain-containing protein [Planctomycetales bacterium]|nr:HEAT repeat domain-containing protein [Planctomycetales bacterium]
MKADPPAARREAPPPKDAPFPEVRRRALAALGSEDFLTRREGLSWLAGRPEAEAPVLVLDALARVPVDADAAERRAVPLADRILWRAAVVETLASFRADAAFWTLVAPASADGRGWEAVCAVLDALGEIAATEPRGPAGIARRASLAAAIAARLGAASAVVRTAATRAIGRLGIPEIPLPAEALAPLFADTAWPVRWRAIEAAGALKSEASVEPLIAALARETGRVREAAQAALLAITGADVPDDPDLWRAWLKARRETGSLVGKRGRGPGTQRAPRFYGIPVTGSRVAFVVDTTGSMLRRHDPAAVARWLARDAESGRPPYRGANFLDLAKYELSNAIRELPGTTAFTVVTFSSDLVKVWAPALVRASAESKAEALAWVDALGGGGGTNLYDGLVRAFELAERQSVDFATGPDTVLLFTDGEVNMGSRTNPGEIRAILRALHGLRHVRLHTIGLGTYDADMLRGLAEDSGGTFVDVPIPLESKMADR